MKLHGVDFTSAPRHAKPITVATLAAIEPDVFALEGFEALV